MIYFLGKAGWFGVLYVYFLVRWLKPAVFNCHTCAALCGVGIPYTHLRWVCRSSWGFHGKRLGRKEAEIIGYLE
jgi:hypothetical protein